MNSPLLEPYRGPALHLPNRTAMAAMTRARADDATGAPIPLMAEYYAQRATAGLIVSEGIWPHRLGKGGPGVPGLTGQAHVEGWRRVTRAVHDAGGRVFAQLWHVGRVSHPDILGGEQPVAPSAVAVSPGHGQIYTASGPQEYVVPRALTTAEVTETVEAHASAARNAIDAGFDGVEISGAYGYLLAQFLSDNANLRTDGYGDHVRFVIEVVEAVAAAIGADRTALRVSPGNPLLDTVETDPASRYHRLLDALNGMDLAYLHVVQSGKYAALADLRPRWNGTLVATYDGPEPGSREQAEQALRTGLADVYSFGRLFLANPDLPRRIADDAPLNPQRASGMYGGGGEGYVDYPVLAGSSVGPAPGSDIR
ncbi:alkene reductase [Streptomyces durmitorensis]|uniref:Alkene reductase n=1 Tax=Streptomyces durmitorensis TaxID=319947 RepID=A0ABY4PL57_9ACTN|nr:alkene reductase [Streptomyces durmitorensis]UQT54110.1 alkene reductase [Streptomyces durmitorensis]